MTKVLYISTTVYSGSTLSSFLLNTHPKVTTIGHTSGWNFAEDEDFYCSCGKLIQECPFFLYVKSEFEKNGLPFKFNEFGTVYKIVKNERISDYFVSKTPFIESSRLEKLRDKLLFRIPYIHRKLTQQDLANKTLIESALAYGNTSIYVDNSQIPYKLRHLKRIPSLDIYNMHLIRDPRGFALSMKRNDGRNVDLATKMWLDQHSAIIRISQEFPNTIRIIYEELCRNVNDTLNGIFAFAGLEPHDFDGDFKVNEHHILGNNMRMKGGKVKESTEWRTKLSKDEITTINQKLKKYAQKHPDSPLSDVIDQYLSN